MADRDRFPRVGGIVQVLVLALGSGVAASLLAIRRPGGEVASGVLAGLAAACLLIALGWLLRLRGDLWRLERETGERVHRAEAALNQLREALDELPSGIEIYDSGDRLLLYNKRLLELYPWIGFEAKMGHSFESILRESMAQGRIPYAAGREEQWLAQRLATRGRHEGPILQSLKGGQWINTYERRTPSNLVVGVRLEVTDLVQKTRELEDSQARLQAIIHSAAAAIVSMDSHGVILEINAAGSQLFGRPASELVGQPLSTLIPACGETAGGDRDGPSLPVRPVRDADVEVIGRDGSALPLHLSISQIHSAVGRQFVAIITDLTQRKQAEEARLKAELLEAQNRQIQEANRRKSQFLAHMSHEIRTPLNAVLGLARIGSGERSGGTAPGRFQGILDAGQHLLSIVDDILDFSKLEAGKLSVERRPFQLSAAIETVVGLVAGSAAAKALALPVELAPDLPEWVEGDALRLRQVLANLLGNAVKFTDRGRVALKVWPAGDRVVFEVADTGIGMGAAARSRLFQPFEQADSSTTRRFGGTGLGLAISHDLTLLMGGEIEVLSDPGQGSVFTVRLPLPQAAAIPPSLPGGCVQSPRLAGLRVLAAEDNDVNRVILQAQLEAEGCAVEFARNGLEALASVERAGAAAYDAVLMDIQMPVMDGMEAARRLRELAPTLPVIGVTAHALPDERERCLAAGMVDHVAKPVDIDRLVACLQQHIGRPPVAGPPGRP